MALPIVNSSRYTAEIPSTGKSIEFRPFLVKEEKLLMVALESNDTGLTMRTLKDIIKNCVFDDIDVNVLTTFDIEWLFLQLRSKSVGEVVDIKLPCSECDTPMEVKINLEKIKMDKTISKDDKVIMLTDDVGIEFNYPSVNMVEKIDQSLIVGEESPEKQMSMTIDIIIASIKSIFDADNVYDSGDSTKEELVKFVDQLNSAQFARIASFFSDLPALTHTVEFKCGSCGHDNEIELRGLQSFFT